MSCCWTLSSSSPLLRVSYRQRRYLSVGTLPTGHVPRWSYRLPFSSPKSEHKLKFPALSRQPHMHLRVGTHWVWDEDWLSSGNLRQLSFDRRRARSGVRISSSPIVCQQRHHSGEYPSWQGMPATVGAYGLGAYGRRSHPYTRDRTWISLPSFQCLSHYSPWKEEAWLSNQSPQSFPHPLYPWVQLQRPVLLP